MHGAAEAWIAETAARIKGLRPEPGRTRPSLCSPEAIEPFLLHDRAQYLTNIDRCKERIVAGESYEICLTNRARVPLARCSAEKAFECYLDLRAINPAPYSCFLRFGSVSVLCSSPERFLTVDEDGLVESRPIKGTMPRDKDVQKDQRNKELLATDRRFYSENLMILDLIRNDLTRSCIPGTINTPRLMAVESYATVHQLVSSVQGKLNASIPACIVGCFPGGSMTGAPKRRTLEIIDELENALRGIYSGSIGYLSLNSTADLNIVIRTIVIHEDVAEIGVGGAITFLSMPELEYDEMLLKAIAPFSALQPLMTAADRVTEGDSGTVSTFDREYCFEA
jgi:anthranilate/para-aminobenzoate synthase component I